MKIQTVSDHWNRIRSLKEILEEYVDKAFYNWPISIQATDKLCMYLVKKLETSASRFSCEQTLSSQ